MNFLIGITWQILRSLRIRQWLKNLVLFAPIIFSGQVFETVAFSKALIGFTIFCLTSSAAYLFNDVVDAPKDRAHPYKKLRPVAAGRLPATIALITALLLVGSGLYWALVINSRFFLYNLIFFIALQISYSLLLRNKIILDALTVSLAFILRVFAGSFITGASISSWLVLATIGMALLLSFGKRRSERTLLATGPSPESLWPGLANTVATRTTLFHYPDTLLDSMISVSASFALISYCLFSFQISPRGPSRIFSSLLPPTLFAPKWMMLTIPFVIYAVARYLYVIYEKKEGESPERILLSDRPLTLTLIGWTLTTIFVIYFLGT